MINVPYLDLEWTSASPSLWKGMLRAGRALGEDQARTSGRRGHRQQAARSAEGTLGRTLAFRVVLRKWIREGEVPGQENRQEQGGSLGTGGRWEIT